MGVKTELESRQVRMYSSLPDKAPGWKWGLFWAAGLLYVEAGTTLPFFGATADLEYVFVAGDVCAAGVILSTASLGNKHF